MNVIIYVYIRTHRWLYVVITTKTKNGRRNAMRRYVLEDVQSEERFINDIEFWVRYFIGTTLLVIIHITRTQKWAAQCNAPLRSGRRTMMDGFIY